MDAFYKELALLLAVMLQRSEENNRFLYRVLDAKDAILSLDQIADNDAPLVSRLLDDHLKTQALISDNKESFEKFMKMYT